MKSDLLLLVEDNADEVTLMREALAHAGISFPVQVLRDGEEAIAYFEGRGAYADRGKHPLPRLIFLDLQLPKRSGLEVVRWLKEHPVHKRIPVVIVSSSRTPADVDRAYGTGANSYVAKPHAFKEFVEVIRTTATYWINYNLPVHS